ncbi:MAG TPA: site-specific integrase [Ruminococcus sp.]|nr:site-specific integrase [Ruminococcus sp.]HRU98076.1 site-specific integrase [Ruminococcus sp.]
MKASLPYKYIISVKNGKHYVVFDFKDKAGKRKRKWASTGLPEKCTKKALNEAVEQIVAEFAESWNNNSVILNVSRKGGNTAEGDEKIVVNQELNTFFTDWLTAIKANSARTTFQCYKRNAERFMQYMGNHYPDVTLADLNYTHVQSYLNHKMDEGVKGSTVKQYYLALHSAFAYAVKMEMLTQHPMDKMIVPRADRHEAVFYNEDELNELFEVFKGHKLELIVHIAAYYGLRRCEILGLKWDSIDFKKKTLSIERKVVSDYDENGQPKLVVETRLKTNSTRRTLPLIPHIEEMLLEKQEMDKRYKKLGGKNYDTEFEGFICCDPYGKLISPNTVTHDFHDVIKKKGLKMLRFHDLRHSCASLLLANDIPMKAIQEWLGHATFNITANLYSHLEYNAKVTSAETIARVLGGKKEAPAYTDEPETKKSDSRKMKNDTITDTSQAAAV